MASSIKKNVFSGLNEKAPEAPQKEVAPERSKREIITEYEIDKIKPSADNTFSQNKDAQYEELKASIAADGIYEPLKIYSDPKHEGKYIIFSGHRRFSVAKELGLKKVPCVLIKGTFTPSEINTKLFAFNQGKRGEDPFGKARSIKRFIELQKKPLENVSAAVEKEFHIPHGRSVTRLTTLAKLDNDILVLGQLNLFTAELAETLIAAADAKPGLLKEAQEEIRKIYAKEKDFDSQKAEIKKYVQSVIKKPKQKGQTSPVVTIKRIKKSFDQLVTIDLSGEKPKKKAQLKESLLEIRAMLDEKIKELE